MTPPPADAEPHADDVVVRMRGIGKTYPNGVVANSDVDLVLRRGELHALVGENGAGKSTLMSILYGLEHPTTGELVVDGQTVRFASPTDAARCGIGMVHQEFRLFPSLTVAENLVFGDEPRSGGALLDRRRAAQRVSELAERYGLPVPAGARVRDLPVGVLQRVEILKALHREARVVILDEPTAVLTPHEIDSLFEVLRALCASGHAVVIVTHKLREVMQFTDRITVLRDGRSVATMPTSQTDPAELAHHMTGRAVDLDGRYVPGHPGEVALEVAGLTVRETTGARAVQDVDFTAHRGEIVGIAGVAGSGQSQLLDAIAGLLPVESGSVRVSGTSLDGRTAAQRREHHLAFIPEDRRGTGSAASATIAENLAMGFHRRPPLSRGPWLRRGAVVQHARRLMDSFAVKAGGPRTEAGTLSGGNLQKVVVAREMSHGADVLLVDQPTRGVDVGAIENIHARIRAYRDEGHCVVLSTAELPELFALSDRILVMFSGRIFAEITREPGFEARVGLAMSGVESDPQTHPQETP